MLYTSYFGQMKNFPSSFVPVAICAKPPIWFHGAHYKGVAPSYGCLMDYKDNGNVEAYKLRYHAETLDKLSADAILRGIFQVLPESVKNALESDTYHWTQNPLVHIVLLCFEKPDEFCHRDLVSDKLNECGYKCLEWRKE